MPHEHTPFLCSHKNLFPTVLACPKKKSRLHFFFFTPIFFVSIKILKSWCTYTHTLHNQPTHSV